MDLLSRISNENPYLMKLLVAYTQQTNSYYNQTKRESLKEHNDLMSDYNRTVARRDIGQYLRKIIQ